MASFHGSSSMNLETDLGLDFLEDNPYPITNLHGSAQTFSLDADLRLDMHNQSSHSISHLGLDPVEVKPLPGFSPHCAPANQSELPSCSSNYAKSNQNNVQPFSSSTTSSCGNFMSSKPSLGSQVQCGSVINSQRHPYMGLEEARTPDQDSTFDFNDIMSPGEGYFSRENFMATSQRSNMSDTLNKLAGGPFSRLTNSQKSPPLRGYYHTPSPPHMHATPSQPSNAVAECYFTGQVRPCSTSALSASQSLMNTSPSNAMNRSSTPNSTSSCAHSIGKSSVTVQKNGITKSIVILNHHQFSQQQQIVQPQPMKPCSASCASACLASHAPQSAASTDQETSSQDKERGNYNI